MSQQGVTVYQGTQPVHIQTAQQTVVPVGLPQNSQILPHRKTHKWLGIIQMCIGSFCIILSIIGYCVGSSGRYYHYGLYFSGGGIYTGVFYIIAGLLGYLAYRNNSTYLVVACMVLNIIATIVTVIGLFFLGHEAHLVFRWFLHVLRISQGKMYHHHSLLLC